MKTNKLITTKINMTSRAKGGKELQSPTTSLEPDFEDDISPDWSVLGSENQPDSVHFH